MADLGFLVSDSLNGTPPRRSGSLLTTMAHFYSHIFATPRPRVDYPSEALTSCLDCVNLATFGLRPPGTSSNVTMDFDAPLYDRASHLRRRVVN
jgi:hypothetical protein